MKECNQNTLGVSKSSKDLLIQWESVAATSCSMTLKRKWDGNKRQRARKMGRNFSRVTLAQRMVSE
jgi:hypothetical protein